MEAERCGGAISGRERKAEKTLAHLERQYDDLNAVAIKQGRLPARIQKRLQALGESLEVRESERIRSTNPKPPHHGP